MNSPHDRNPTNRSEPLRVLAIDKVAVLSSYRERYTRLVERADVDLTLLVPGQWVENFTPTPYQPAAEPEPYRTVIGHAIRQGHALQGTYISGLIRAFLRARPDVILMMEEVFSAFALQVMALRSVLAPHAPVSFYSWNILSYRNYPYRLSPLYRVLGLTLMPMFDAALCVNGRAIDAVKRENYPGMIRELFIGINERLFRRVDPASAREQLGIPSETDLFLYAGRLLELKGVQDLIDAVVRLAAERPERSMRLLIVGTGDYEAELRAQVDSLGAGSIVEFRPLVPIEQMPLYMSAATAFVLPSRTEWEEQFGRVNAEAMLTRTPIIGSTSGSIPEVLGGAGYVFRAGDVEDLLRTLRRVLDDPAEVEQKREQGYRRAYELFSTDTFVEGLIDYFEDISGRSIRRREGG